MQPTLTLTGRLDGVSAKLGRAEKREFLSRAAVWFETVGDAVLAAELSEAADGKPILCVCFHPAAEDVEVRLGASGAIRVTAETWPVGPGYHVYLHAVLIAFAADLGITWDRLEDPTGYACSGDADGLGTSFRDALRGACRSLLSHSVHPANLGLPADQVFLHPGPVLTPLGPRSWDWVAEVAANAEDGVDFFPWWSPELDAEFYRNRASVQLRCEFPWRAPLTEEEGELTDQIAADLEMAYSLDPSAPLPWRAWADVLAAIDADHDGLTMQTADPDLRRAVNERAASTPDEPLPGYRRWPLRHTVGPWTLELPGTFTDAWSDPRTWVAWDGSRRVTLRLSERDFSREPVFVQDESNWRLSGGITQGGESLAFEIESVNGANREWAGSVWRSLQLAGVPDSRSSVA